MIPGMTVAGIAERLGDCAVNGTVLGPHLSFCGRWFCCANSISRAAKPTAKILPNAPAMTIHL